jgi:hypothetical protein
MALQVHLQKPYNEKSLNPGEAWEGLLLFHGRPHGSPPPGAAWAAIFSPRSFFMFYGRPHGRLPPGEASAAIFPHFSLSLKKSRHENIHKNLHHQGDSRGCLCLFYKPIYD